MNEHDKNSQHDDGAQKATRELSFTCPKCGRHELYYREEVVNEVLYVRSDGDFELGDEFNEKDLGFCCAGCGYVLEDQDGMVYGGKHLAEWLTAHCPQET